MKEVKFINFNAYRSFFMRSAEPVSLGSSSSEILKKITVRDVPHCLKYLETLDIKKPFFNRMICWMLKFGLLSQKPGTWGAELEAMVSKYESLVSESCADFGLEQVKASLPAIIPRDLGRSEILFQHVFEDLDLPLFDDYQLRLHRIFLVLLHEVKDFEYLQGYDRFLYIMTAVAAAFCVHTGLKSGAIEAFSYQLVKYSLTKIVFSRVILNQEEAGDLYFELDEMMSKHSPATAAAFRSQSLKPEMFALNWLLLLFAEKHPMEDLLVVWDRIFLDIANLETHVLALVVAHLNQVQIGLNTTDTMQRILKTSDFNLERLFRDVEKMTSKERVVVTTNERRGGIPPACVVLGLITIVSVGAAFMYKAFK